MCMNMACINGNIKIEFTLIFPYLHMLEYALITLYSGDTWRDRSKVGNKLQQHRPANEPTGVARDTPKPIQAAYVADASASGLQLKPKSRAEFRVSVTC